MDEMLKTRLKSKVAEDPDFWSFKKNAIRQNTHAFFQYPAMMVPQMLAGLLADVQAVNPKLASVFDPFVGSGTVLTEAMLRGLDFHGRDINPMAILLCRVKAGPFKLPTLKKRVTEVGRRIRVDDGTSLEVSFSGWQKWFRRDVAIRLSRIVRSIRQEKALWSRRFFWVALAETVRLVSNSRTSTFKLHIRPKEQIDDRQLDAEALFQQIVFENMSQLSAKSGLLKDMQMLRDGEYTGVASVALADSSRSKSGSNDTLCDLMITSPPYGDNVSTVPYGQHSYLPLQWIDLADIDKKIDKNILATTHTIDSRSLGGSRRNAIADAEEVISRSPSLANTIADIPDSRPESKIKVAAFFRDLDRSIDSILSHLKPDAYMFWIVGDRRVAKKVVPLNAILSELLGHRNAKMITAFERRIPSKRMAIRNNTAQTMRTETILVMRKKG